jgi:hypothetical protein
MIIVIIAPKMVITCCAGIMVPEILRPRIAHGGVGQAKLARGGETPHQLPDRWAVGVHEQDIPCLETLISDYYHIWTYVL